MAIKQCSRKSQLAGYAKAPFGSFCGSFADVSAVERGKAAVDFLAAPSTQSLRAGSGRGIGGDGEAFGSQIAPLEAPRTKLAALEKSTMSDNMSKGFEQVAAFQKLWTDSFANMASVWSQFSPSSPPSDEMRGGMLKVTSRDLG